MVKPHPRCAPAVLGARQSGFACPGARWGKPSRKQWKTADLSWVLQTQPQHHHPPTHPWYRNKCSMKAKACNGPGSHLRYSAVLTMVPSVPALLSAGGCYLQQGVICSRVLFAAGAPAGLTHRPWKLPHGCMRPRQCTTHLPPQLPSREVPVAPT